MSYSKIKKYIASSLIIALLAPNLVHVDFSYGEELKVEHDLVVLLVEKDLYETGAENQADTLTGKIYRYAEDVRRELRDTKVKIIRVAKNRQPFEIQALLEKYYIEGEINATEINRLKGIVIVGEVPLPVVKFENYYLPTLYPYTDFLDPAFIWDETSQQFEHNPNTFNLNPEIWHGLIQAPGKEKTTELKAFFDKNHSFHLKDKSASTFDQKVFYGDLLQENQNVNRKTLANYLMRNYFREDLAYLRFNKHFAEKVINLFSSQLFPSKNIDDDQDGKIDEDGLNGIDDDQDGQIDEDPGDIYAGVDNDADGKVDEDVRDGIDNDGDGKIDEDLKMSPFDEGDFKNIPDVQSKELIEKFLLTFGKISESYLQDVNNFIEASARYTKAQGDNFPALITKIDELFNSAPESFKPSLKNINTFFEAVLNQKVENDWQKDVQLIESITTSTFDPYGDGGSILQTHLNYLNGQTVSNLKKVEECSLYRGSPFQAEDNFAQQVEYNRMYNFETAGNPSSTCNPYGGCCANNFQNPEACVPTSALKPVFDISANTEKKGVANYQACRVLNFPETPFDGGSMIVNYKDKKFSSVFKHIEPLNQSIAAAIQNQNFNPSIPADAPRYIAFQNNAEKLKEVLYFNVFDFQNTTNHNDLESVKTLFYQHLEKYAQYINQEIATQNLDIFEKYLEKISSTYSPQINTEGSVSNLSLLFQTPTNFTEKYTQWKNETLDYLTKAFGINNKTQALIQYLAEANSQYDAKLEEIFKKYFNLSSASLFTNSPQINSLRDFLNQGGVNLDFSQTYSVPGAVSVTYSLAEVQAGVRKYASVETTEDGSSNTKITVVANYPFKTTNLISLDFWKEQVQKYGEEDILKALQWKNATLDEKREIIFKNYLNQTEANYPTSAPNGYEINYLRAEGGLDYLDLAVPELSYGKLETLDLEWENFLNENEQQTENAEFKNILESSLEDECGSFTEGVPLTQWLSAIQCWLAHLGGSSSSEGCNLAYSVLDAESDFDFNPDFYNFNLTTKTPIKLIAEQSELLANGPLVKIEAEVGTNFPEDVLTFEISQGGDQYGRLLGQNPAQIVNGRAFIYVQALVPNQDFLVYLKDYPNNQIRFKTTGKFLKLSSDLDLTLPQTGETIQIQIRGINGTDENQKVDLVLTNPDLAQLKNAHPVFDKNNVATTSLKILKSGQTQILAKSPGYANGSLELNIQTEKVFLKNNPEEIITPATDNFGSAYNVVFVNPPQELDLQSETTLTVELQNQNGQPLEGDISVTFELTNFSKKFAQIKSSNVLNFKKNSRQNITLQTLRENGLIHLVPQTAEKNIKQKGLELKVGNLITKEEIQALNPQTFYTTLIGDSFADLVNTDNFANHFLFAGKTQAVTTLQGGFKNYPVAANLFPNGSLKINDPTYAVQINQINPLILEVRNYNQNQKELIYQVGFQSEELQIKEFSYALDLEKPGLYLSRFDTSGALFIAEEKQDLVLRRNEDEVLRITPKGQLTLHPDYQFALNTEFKDELFLNILYRNEIVAGVLLNQTKIEKILYASGNTQEFFAEASTQGEKGITVLNTQVAPSLLQINSNDDLADSQNVNGLGWTGDYKNELLFASNVSAGEATQNYASVFEVLLGDPVITLQNITTPNSTSFNQTLGTPLLQNNQEEIQQVVSFNFNNDQLPDLAVVYKNGSIGLLQGRESLAFENLGKVAQISEQINDLEKMTFKPDEGESLLILTTQNELILLRNQEAQLTRETITLSPPSYLREIQIQDFDLDGKIDLLASHSDGSLGIYYGNTNGFEPIPMIVDRTSGKINNTNLANSVLVSSPAINQLDPEKQPQTIALEISLPAEKTSIDTEAITNLEISPQTNPVQFVPKENLSPFITQIFAGAQNASDLEVSLYGKNLNGEFIDLENIIEYTLTVSSQKDVQDLMLTNFIASNFNLIQDSLSLNNCGEASQTNGSVQTANYPFLISKVDLKANQICEIQYQVKVVQTPEITFWIEDATVENYVKDNRPDILYTIEGNTSETTKYLIADENDPRTYHKVYASAENITLPPEIDNTDANGNGVPDRLENDKNGNGIPDYIDEYENQQIEDRDKDGLPDSWDYADENENLFKLDNLNSSLNNVVDYLSSGCKNNCLNIPVNYAFFVPGNINLGLPGMLTSRLGINTGSVKEPPLVLPVFAWGHHLAQTATKCVMRIGPYCVPTPQPTWELQPLFAADVSRCTCNSGELNANWLNSWEKSLGRVYLSPTLTGALGTGICIGPKYLSSLCFAWSVNVLGSLCESSNASAGGARSRAASVNASNGRSVFTVGAGANTAEAPNNGYSYQFELDNLTFAKVTNVNRHVTEIGNILTKWINRQIEEVSNALMDLPTVYLYYPTFDRVFESEKTTPATKEDLALSEMNDDWGVMQQVKKTQTGKEVASSAEQGVNGIKNAYDTIKSIPFITLDRKDVKMKVPYLNKESINSLRTDWTQWKNEARAEINKTQAEWGDTETILQGCDYETLTDQPLSDKCIQAKAMAGVLLESEKLIETVDQNLITLEDYAKLPREIIKYQEDLIQYLDQATCLTNEIMNVLGGWVVKNMIRYKLWKQFIITLELILEGWKNLLDVMLNYKDTCEVCRAESYSTSLWDIIGMLLPEPPIITFPRWPDIKIDLSQINSELNLALPRLHFIPEPLIFPQIPALNLPSPPTFGAGGNLDFLLNLKLPGIPLLPELPPLPTLPELPNLELPELPDLPPPPRIPSIPGNLTSLMELIDLILQIYCFIKKGIWLYPEDTLKDTIENLTSRPSGFSEVFDFLHLNVADFNIAGYDLLVESQVNLELDADYIAEAAKSMADPWNDSSTNLVDQADFLTAEIANQIKTEINASQYLPDGLKEDLNLQIEATEEGVQEETEKTKSKFQSNATPDYVMGGHAAVISQALGKMRQAIKNQNQIQNLEEIRTELDSNNLRRMQEIKSMLEAEKTKLKQEIQQLTQADSLKAIAVIPETTDYKLTNLEIIEPQIEEFSTTFATLTQEELLANQKAPLEKKVYVANAATEALSPAQPLVEENNLNATYNYQGAYLYDEATKQVLPLLKYEDEAETIKQTLFVDYDNDKDEDLVYLMTNNLYLKENYKKNPAHKIYIYKTQVSDLENLTIPLQAVKNYQVTNLNNQKISVTWDVYQAFALEGYLITNQAKINPNVENQKQDYYYFSTQLENASIEVNAKKAEANRVYQGPAEIKINQNLILTLKTEETFWLQENENELFTFKLPNGFYYSSIQAVLTDGTVSTHSPQILLAPQIGADQTAPIVIAPQKIKMYLNEIKTLNSNLFLDDTAVTNVQWKADSAQQNNLIQSVNQSIQIGPFQTPQTFNLTLTAKDAADNQAQTNIFVEVLAPAIELAPDVLVQTKNVEGKVLPNIAQTPFSLYRERFGKTKLIQTDSADLNGKYLTKADGSYLINDLNQDLGVIIKDNLNQQIAYVHNTTGRIELKDTQYSLDVLAANENYPVRIVVRNQSGAIVANEYLIADYNNDIQIENFAINKTNFANLDGVHLFDTDSSDAFVLLNLPGNAPFFPGGAVLLDQIKQTNLVLFNTDGKIILLDQQLQLALKKNNVDDPLILEVQNSEGKILTEIFIAIPAINPNLEILPDQRWSEPLSYFLKPLQKTKQALIGAVSDVLPFKDIDTSHPAYGAILELYQRKILSGYEDGTMRPDSQLSRAEFVKIALGATACLDCTRPTEAERLEFEAEQPFPDVALPAWYYYCVAKGKANEMITGYGDGFFRPEQFISRAEASAIILREAEIDLTVNPNQVFFDVPQYAWYRDYVYTAVSIGMIPNHLGFVFPDELITRGEFAMMAKKLLELKDCRLNDTDKDGMPDYWEIENQLNPESALDASFDNDKDGLTNLEELNPSTNPNNRDSNADGILDGDDGTGDDGTGDDGTGDDGTGDDGTGDDGTGDDGTGDDGTGDDGTGDDGTGDDDLCPLIPGDNQGCPSLTNIAPLPTDKPGIYIVPGSVNECIFIDYLADIHKGDKIFTAISSENHQDIWSKSEVCDY